MSTTPPAALDILVVDDSDVDAQLTLQALTHFNPRPRTLWLSDSRQAMDYLMRRRQKARSRELPSLVLTDMRMPWLSGLELLTQIRAESRLCRLPVIMLSGAADSHELLECYRLGADGVSGGVKPLDSGGDRRFLVMPGSLDVPGVVVSSLARAAC